MAWQEHKISSCSTFLPLQLSLSALGGWSFAIFNMQLQELIELKNSTLSYKHSSQMGFRNESKTFAFLNTDSLVISD